MLIELMDLLENYTIQKTEEGYEVEHKLSEVAALINFSGDVSFFVTGVYNHGMEWMEIDTEKLDELKKICVLLREHGLMKKSKRDDFVL